MELEKNIKILYACESGSRAWGFGSPDSDYDVRFFFIHQKEKYLSVSSPLDSIDRFFDNDVDLSAWEIKKALGLLLKSNATPFEWLQSPILYRKNDKTEKFRNEFWELSKKYFSAKTLIFHYLGIAKGMLSKIENNQISIKKYFYILRPVLAAYYIKTKNEAAPMEFKFLVENLDNQAIKEAIKNLWKEKLIAKEGDKIEIPAFIHSFIKTQISECGLYASNLKREEKNSEPLNEFFRNLL
ncbi:putative nucleotidyltransferase [Bernardetia litoralis DSM 6794]|uniref:Putative nucleotidyltransferase n=1 Tax=Bernardetia litoralis (strain ATCC 23117 / DSM 6794 / NBRC 15988 / NCIMB 1366 / Fx l1 / Sio-4) TaxID=880071 RepID=I4APR6_BERLS|nr:nucleotidyltransferase domain-containing protein [Bernardetia litoralis]AFM05951.1 putative nucleotidyltransferase [Bernardetia litoralis DSM 6794]